MIRFFNGALGGALVGTELWPVSWHGAALGAACGLLVACRSQA